VTYLLAKGGELFFSTFLFPGCVHHGLSAYASVSIVGKLAVDDYAASWNSYYFRMGEKVPLIRDFGAGEG